MFVVVALRVALSGNMGTDVRGWDTLAVGRMRGHGAQGMAPSPGSSSVKCIGFHLKLHRLLLRAWLGSGYPWEISVLAPDVYFPNSL